MFSSKTHTGSQGSTTSGVSGPVGASAGSVLHIPHLNPTHGHSGSPLPLRPFRKLWENIKAEERETVGNFELYSEIMGVCQGCFTPGTTHADSPRTHHYGQRWHPKKGWRVKRKKTSKKVLFGWIAPSRICGSSSASSISSSSSSSNSNSIDSGSDLSDDARKRKILQRALRRQEKREFKSSFYSSHRRRGSNNTWESTSTSTARQVSTGDGGVVELPRFHSPADSELKDYSKRLPAYGMRPCDLENSPKADFFIDEAVSGASSTYVSNTTGVPLDNTDEPSRDPSWENWVCEVWEPRNGKQAMVEEVAEAIESNGWESTEVYGESASSSDDRTKLEGVTSRSDTIYEPELPEGPAFERSKSEMPTAVARCAPALRHDATDRREGSRSVTPTPPGRRSAGEERQGDAEFRAIAIATAEDVGFNPGIVLGEAITMPPEPRSSDSTTTFVDSPESLEQVQIGRGMPIPEGRRLRRTQTERIYTRHTLVDQMSTPYPSESSSGTAIGSLEHGIRLADTPNVPPPLQGPGLEASQTERVEARHPVLDSRNAVVEQRVTSNSSESRSSGVTASVSRTSDHQTQSVTVPGIPQMPEGQRLKRSQTERVDPRAVVEERGTSYPSEPRVDSRSGAEGSERGRAFPEGHRLKRSMTERPRPTKTRPTADERAPFYSSPARARSVEFITKIDGAPNITEGLPFQQGTSSSSLNSQVHGYDSSRTIFGYSADVSSALESEFATPPTGGTMDNTPTTTTRNTPVSRQNALGSQEGSRSVTPTPPSRRSTEERKQGDADFTAIAMAAAEDAGFNPGLVLGETIIVTPEATTSPIPVDQRSVEEEERKHDRSRSLSRIPEVLRSGSRSKPRRQRTRSLFGRSKASDSMSSDSRADSMAPGSGGVSLESSPPTLERGSTDTARNMSFTASVLTGMKRLGGGSDKSRPPGVPEDVERLDPSFNLPHTTPPASITDGRMPGRRSRKGSVTYHSDDSQILEETKRLAAGSGRESNKEKKERLQREKKEKKEEKERSSGEAGSPESGQTRWGGLFGKLGVKQTTPATSPSRPSLASVARVTMAEAAATKIPSPPTRSGSDEGETHTRPTTSSGRSLRSLAGLFGGGESGHQVDKGTIEISDPAGTQAGEKGIPVPRGGLRRGRSVEFAELIGRGSLDDRRQPLPFPELSEGQNSWRNSRDLGMNLDQVAGINRADTRTPEQIPLPTPDVAKTDQGSQGPETRIPQPSTSSNRKGLARNKTGNWVAASSEFINSLPEQHQSGDVNDTETGMKSHLPLIRRTETLKDDGSEAPKNPAEPPNIYDDRDIPSPIQSPYVA